MVAQTVSVVLWMLCLIGVLLAQDGGERKVRRRPELHSEERVAPSTSEPPEFKVIPPHSFDSTMVHTVHNDIIDRNGKSDKQRSAKGKGTRRKKGRKTVRGKEGGSGDMDCDSVMNDPTDQMSDSTKDMMCDMYKKWGSGVHKRATWKPTRGQQEWFDSLGMNARSNNPETRDHGVRKLNPNSITDSRSKEAYHKTNGYGGPNVDFHQPQESSPRQYPYRHMDPPIPREDYRETGTVQDDRLSREKPRDQPAGHYGEPHEGTDDRGYYHHNLGHSPVHDDPHFYRAGRRHRRQSGPGPARRKEYRALSDEERRRLHQAIVTLKNSRMDGMSKYDVFVGYHQANMAPGAHFGPAFLPWHRELLFRPDSYYQHYDFIEYHRPSVPIYTHYGPLPHWYWPRHRASDYRPNFIYPSYFKLENALREIDPTVSLPYWDSNLDSHIGDQLARRTVMWSDDFLGNGDGLVTTGPFANWPLTTTVFGHRVLHRNLTVAPPNARTMAALMTDQAVSSIIGARSLRDITWFVDAEFEGRHGATHNWVGGVMGDLANSPNDPSFFLHHAFIDCLWEQMRRTQRRRYGIDVRFDYPNDTRALGVGIVQPDGVRLTRTDQSFHYWTATMQPFGPMTNMGGLKNEYFDRFYECAPSPTCSPQQPDCGTPYLFCDTSASRCAPKIMHGTRCGRFNSDICYNGECCNGVCQPSCLPPPSPPRQFRPPPRPVPPSPPPPRQFRPPPRPVPPPPPQNQFRPFPRPVAPPPPPPPPSPSSANARSRQPTPPSRPPSGQSRSRNPFVPFFAPNGNFFSFSNPFLPNGPFPSFGRQNRFGFGPRFFG